MKQYFYIIILFISFVCCSKKTKKEIIPKKEFISIIVDMQKTDGILSIFHHKKKYSAISKREIHNDIITNHGFTRKQYDSTLNMYSKENLSELEQIYAEVIEELNRINASDIQEISPEKFKGNLWNQHSNFKIFKKSKNQMMPFKIPIEGKGIYTIKAKIKVFNNDESQNPRIRAYYWYQNDTSKEYEDYFELKLHSNGYFTNYIISKAVPNNKVTHLRGWLVYHEPQKDKWNKHIEVRDVDIRQTSIKTN